MKRVALVTLALFGASCKHADIPPPPPLPSWRAQMIDNGFAADLQVSKLADEYIDLVARTEPETATRWGLHVGDGELDDRSAAGEGSRLVAQKALLQRVEAVDSTDEGGNRLSLAANTDLALLRGALRRKIRIAQDVSPFERQPDYYTDVLSSIFLVLARDFAPAADRARSALSRLERLPETVTVAKTNLKDPPELWVKIGIESAKGAKGFFVEAKAKLVSMLPDEKARIDLAIRRADAAYADYARWLERDLLKRSKKEFAAGRPLFEFLLREDYFLKETPEQLEALGQRVFDRTDAELTKTAKTIDPSAPDWASVIAKLKANHPAASDLIPTYAREVTRARQFLVAKEAVPFPEGDQCEVVETPQFLRGTIQAAYDQPPAFDTNAVGLFYVTPVDPTWKGARQEEWLRENDHGDIVDTAVHETYPGHHLQLSFSRLYPARIRKVLDSAIFAEGWALYSEELMSELGYYTPEERMLVLEWSLVRAARVLLDVGLHVKGMSYDDAVQLLVDKVHLERTLAENEVKRYSESPTQPLSYMVGPGEALRAPRALPEGAAAGRQAVHTPCIPQGSSHARHAAAGAARARDVSGGRQRPAALSRATRER